MKRRLLRAHWLAITVFVAVAVSAQAPEKKSGATITGIVLGPDDKPVSKASVMCQSAGGLAPHATYTDRKGRFTITGLKQDSYDVRASSKDVFSEWEKNIPLRKGQTMNLQLHLIYAREMPEAAGAAKRE